MSVVAGFLGLLWNQTENQNKNAEEMRKHFLSHSLEDHNILNVPTNTTRLRLQSFDKYVLIRNDHFKK